MRERVLKERYDRYDNHNNERMKSKCILIVLHDNDDR